MHKAMGLRLAIRIVEIFLLFAVPVFLSAGTIAWPEAWFFVAISTLGGISIGLRLWRNDPALLAERMKPLLQPGQPLWDRLILTSYAVLLVGWLVVMGLDRRFGWSSVPYFLSIAGALICLGCWLMMELVFRANTFLAPTVKIQRERDHSVVSDGPYAIVRHPMYAVQVVYFFAGALLLGSWWALIGAALLTIVLAVRVPLEEDQLRRNLAGYGDYMTRVRYRLIPGLW
jgi:protein-S-isoprenylcysteine O-methyltransferase Ste14